MRLVMSSLPEPDVEDAGSGIAVLCRKGPGQKGRIVQHLGTEDIHPSSALTGPVTKGAPITEVIGIHNFNTFKIPGQSVRGIAPDNEVVGLIVFIDHSGIMGKI